VQVFLETPRLVLRRFTMADVDILVSLDADPDVMRYVTGGIATTREEIENEILPGWLAYYEEFEGYGFWAAFAEFGVRRVIAEAMAVNLASRRVMEKSGLKLMRTFRSDWPYRIEGDDQGDVEYALDKADWEATSP